MPIPIYKIVMVMSFVLFSSSIYMIQTDVQQTQLTPDQNYSLPTAQHGLQAHLDPVTKQFTRPTQQQRQSAQTKQTLPQTNQLKQRHLPDGSVILDLQQRYRLDGPQPTPSGANNS